ncbi:MAG TPA: MFS transporter [Methanobacteriales archaeon]|nr:MAG: Drug resistance transporter EmrB/QacA subfamily [Methanobacteriaceae archaeon 41_258]HIH62289.1 MFS transporter [Methanobacteriales archaeon]
MYRSRYLVLATIMIGSIMGPIDASIVNTILPVIARSFNTSISMVQWVPMIYLLTISSLLLFYGRLGDLISYKKIYLLGLIGFTIASLLCALSPTIEYLVFFRGFQGVAAGMMMAVPYAIITSSFPVTERGKAFGINAISISAGLAIGPSLGGFVTFLWGWRSAFFINVPIGLIGIILTQKFIQESKGQSGRIDIAGAVTAFISLFSFLYFVNRSQSVGLNHNTVSALLVGIISAILFIFIENRVSQPMLNLKLFNNITFSFANLSALLNFMSQYVMVFLTPFYLQRLLYYTPEKIGLIMTSFPLAVMMVAPFSGYLSDKIGTRILSFLGASICAVALFFMAQLSIQATSSDIIWRMALFGVGTGIFQSPNNNAVMSSAPKPYLGIASGVLATMRNVGMVLGIATGGAVLYASVPDQVLQVSFLEGKNAIVFLSGLKYAYLTGAMLTGVAAITSLLTKN